MSLVKLTRRNDWGTQYYTLPNRGLSDHGTVSYDRHRIDIPKGTKVQCTYVCPVTGNTTSIECKVDYKNVYDTVSDWGRTDSVTTRNFPYLVLQNGKKKTTLELDEVLFERSFIKQFEIKKEEGTVIGYENVPARKRA